MWASSWLPFGLLVSYLRSYSPISVSNDQLTQAYEIEEAEALEILQATEFQLSHGLAASTPEGSVSLESHGYTDVDMHGGIIGILSERYNENSNLVLELFIDTETQVLIVFEDNLKFEEDETDSLQLHEIMQALFLKRNMDINEIKWAAVNTDESLARTASRNYRKENGLGPNNDIKIVPADPSWSMFSSTSSYKSISQIVPGAEIDRMVVANSKPLGSDGESDSVLSVMLMLSFKMPLDGDAAPIDAIDEHAAELAAEDDLKDGLKAAIEALGIHMKYIAGVVDDFDTDALEESDEVIPDPVSVTA